MTFSVSSRSTDLVETVHTGVGSCKEQVDEKAHSNEKGRPAGDLMRRSVIDAEKSAGDS